MIEFKTKETRAAAAGPPPASIPSEKSPGPSNRLHFIDGIRALAALFVVICHAFFEPANGYYSSKRMNHLGLTYGHLAVDMFIVLSGFCLALPMARRDGKVGPLSEFFLRRARRILPPYYAALLLSCVFILAYAHNITGTAWDNSLPLTWPTLLKHVLLIHDLPLPGSGGSIDYPLWSIAVEVQLYLVMPLIAFSLRRFQSVPTLIVAIAVGIGLHIISRGRLDSAFPWYLGLFTMGAVAAREGRRRDPRAAKHAESLLIWVWIGIVLVILANGKVKFDRYESYVDTFVGFGSALLLYACLSDNWVKRRRLMRLLSWPPLVFVGIFSYSLYLVHAPLLHLFDRILSPYVPSGPPMFFALVLCTPLCVGFAYLFHIAFERPFMSKRSLPATSNTP